MKKFSKIAAILAALVMACAFIGCTNDDDISLAGIRRSGTYIGDPAQDESITVTVTKDYKSIDGDPEDVMDTYTTTISNGKVNLFDIDYTRSKITDSSVIFDEVLRENYPSNYKYVLTFKTTDKTFTEYVEKK